jgi:glutathione S-transferase
MITIHHLADSRSQRILWLAEELGLDYEVKYYPRYLGQFSPPEYQALHGLGKSPVITDGSRTIAESGAIIEYILETYGKGRMRPPVGTDDWVRYLQWMHLVEGSVMLPYILGIYVGMLGAAGVPLHERTNSEIKRHFDFLETEMTGRDFVVGNDITGADFQLTFLLEGAAGSEMLGPYPALRRYFDLMRARPAYARAIARGGSYDLNRLKPKPYDQ